LIGDEHPRGEALLSPEACWMTLDMLSGNPPPGQGFRSEWTLADHPIPWKTGTSNGFRDAWAVGVLGDHVLVVWVGHPDGHGDPTLVGREVAGPLFFALADALRAERVSFGEGLARPRSLVKVPVCALSGALTTDACPLQRRAWFWPGVSPVRACEVHRKVVVDLATGRRVCRGTRAAGRASTRVEVDEFWPSDLLRIFAQAGLPRRLPPAPDPECSLDALAATGDPPEIVSPVRGVTYVARLTGGEAFVPLMATADADVRKISWFLGGQMLGESDPREPYLWPAAAGDYVVRAVDDHGRSTSRNLAVGLE
jgi:penicillin-binding protein 1C